MKNRRTLYVTDYCLTPYEDISHSGILCEADTILGVGGASAFVREPDLEVINLGGCYAVPGFIDSHIHGAGGFDSSTAHRGELGIDAMSMTLASHGVTSFVPTLVSAEPHEMLASISRLAEGINSTHCGAVPVGIHAEGPFINKVKHGSQRVEDIREIDMGFTRELIEAGRGHIKLLTFAPELQGSLKLIELLLENGIIPSMGHSSATEGDVLKAVSAGCTRCTHLFNGMPPLHQRNITLTSVAMTDDRITIELILDGEHLHPRMVDLACRVKPKDKLIGVSDSIEATGIKKDGTFHIGSSEIKVHNGLARTEDGTLAGTTMTLETGWHHLVTYSHMTRPEAAACFTSNPAKNLKLDRIGLLRPGYVADISFFDSRNNTARLTVSKGKIIFDSDGKFINRGRQV